MRPGGPFRARKATSRSPRSITRLTRPPGVSSRDCTTGIQYSRRSRPMAVSGPVLVSRSLSSRVSIASSSPGWRGARDGESLARIARARRGRRLGVDHPEGEIAEEGPEAGEVLGGKAVAGGRVGEHAVEAAEPLIPGGEGDGKR